VRKIHYIIASEGGLTGGQKMALRHVETLCELGFDASCYLTRDVPHGIEHRAPVWTGEIGPGDVAVVADDLSPTALLKLAAADCQVLVFAQNPYAMASMGLDGLNALQAAGKLRFMAVAPRLAATLRRLYPDAPVEVVRCFADERRFGPAEKSPGIALARRKRPTESAAVASLFRKLHPEHAAFGWRIVEKATERQTAAAFACSPVFLSLSRLESVGMTTLEAMASGCVAAGFLGVGGREYATPDNGFWAPEDDCEAAADALAEACAVAKAGGPALQRRLEAGFETARQWSYAAFRQELEAAWMRLAPDARVSDRPLEGAPA